MEARQLSQLILYIVDQAADLGGYTTTIRLVKFLYLIDLEHQRRYGRILTGLQWQYYLHGPYAFDLPTIGARLGFDLQREEIVTVKGHRGTLLSTSGPQDFPARLGFGPKALVDGLLRVWSDQETADLLRYAYHTEPMRHAQRGDILDFSVVPEGTYYYEFHAPSQKQASRQLRESLRSYALDDEDKFIIPATVHDEVLNEGLRALDTGEAPVSDFAGITVAVNINELHATLPDSE